jgi:hypothetical protein
MSICLCNLSSDKALEVVAHKELEITPASPDPSLFSVDDDLLSEALDKLGEPLPSPMEFLVGSAQKRLHSRGVSCHVWKGPLPKGGVVSLADGVYVSSPEFTLLQQSTQLHQASLCKMLGRYLGTWSPIIDDAGGQGKRAPLTTFESLTGFLSGVNNVLGCNNLRLAMAYTCENAASAPETALQLALSLPPELYGLQIMQPIMNYEIDLSSAAQKLYPHATIRMDLCWPHKRFGLEYQGEGHGNRLGQDFARWLAARMEGYELWFVAKDQLESAAQMMYLGREVAKRIDFEVDEILWPSESELQDLLDILNGKKHLGPIRYREMRERRTAVRKRKRATPMT